MNNVLIHLPRPLQPLSAAAITLAGAIEPFLVQAMQYLSKQKARPARPLTKPQTFEGLRWFEAGKTRVTFLDLFGAHLAGAHTITIVDPHIKTFRQIRLFDEFLENLSASSNSSEELNVHLVTSTAKESHEWAYGQAKALVELQESALARGIKLCVKFDETVHDRWIQTNEWTIMLGKGLDIWDAATCYSRPQAERPIAKKFAITYTVSATAN